jgi:hypothetical protein
MMDFDKIVSAIGDHTGILINIVVFQDEETVKIESRHYEPNDPDFALAIRALQDFASRDDPTNAV